MNKSIIDLPDPFEECVGDWDKVSSFVLGKPNRSVISNFYSGLWVTVLGGGQGAIIHKVADSLTALQRMYPNDQLPYDIPGVFSIGTKVSAYLKIKSNTGGR